MDENHEKLSNPQTTRQGDSLAYIAQLTQLHHLSKVNLKQWPRGLKIFFVTNSWFWIAKLITVWLRMSVTWHVWSSLAD